MAGNNGKRFEGNFKKSALNQGLFFERFIDSNKFNFGEGTRFTPQNPSDCFIFDTECLYYIELKSTIGTSISFNQPCTEKGKGTYMIKPHQVNALLERSNYPNVYCMLILDYADRVTKGGTTIEGGTYAIPIKTFVDWANSVDKKSINLNDCQEIGIQVPRKRKKINYTYDIKTVLDVIKQCQV